MASKIRISAVTIGELAKKVHMSKSGLFAHFRSKENLQVEILKYTGVRFKEAVFDPSLKAPKGVARLKMIVQNWIQWLEQELPGGCPVLNATAEFSNEKGPVRDITVQMHKDLLGFLNKSVSICVQTGEFNSSTDVEMVSFQLYSLVQGYQRYRDVVGDKKAKSQLMKTIDQLIQSHRN